MVLGFRSPSGRSRWPSGLALTLAIAAAPHLAAQPPPRYYMITDLGPGEAQKIQNLGLGYTVGSLFSPVCPGFEGSQFGFLWEGPTNKRHVFCPLAGDAASAVFDFEMLGGKSAAGYSRSTTGVDQAVIWGEQTDGSFLPRLLPAPAGSTSGVAWGTEPSGRVWGEVQVGGERRAAYWMTPSAAPAIFPTAGTSAAFSFAGSIFDPVLAGPHQGRFALWYPNRSPVLVTYPLGETPSVAFRLRSDSTRLMAAGQTSTENGDRAFLWQSDTGLTLLPPLPFGSEAGARDFWTTSRIVGYSRDGSGHSRAVLWEGVFPLNLDELKMPTCRSDDPVACAPWTLQTASSISQAGTIVGSGLLDGEPHAFLARPVELLTWNANVCAAVQQPFCVAQPSRVSNELIIDPFEVKDQQPPKSASAANAYAAAAKAYVENNGIWIPNAGATFRSYVVFESKSVMDALLPGQTALDVRFHFKVDALTAGSSSPNTTGGAGVSMALRPARNIGSYAGASGSMRTNNGVTQRFGVLAGQYAGSNGDVELPMQLQPLNSNPLEVRIEGGADSHTLASGPTWASANASVRFCSEDPRSITLADGTPLQSLGIKYTMYPTVRREEDEEDPCRNPLKEVVNETPVCQGGGGGGGDASFRIVAPDVIMPGEAVEILGIAKPPGGSLTVDVPSGNATVESTLPCTTYPDGTARCPVVVRASQNLAADAVVAVRLSYAFDEGGLPCTLEGTALLLFSRLQFIDPIDGKVPRLLDTSVSLASQPVEFLKRDAELLSKEGRRVHGVAADGVTPIIFRLRATGPGTVTFSVRDNANLMQEAAVGRLADPFVTPVTYTNPLTVTVRQVGTEFWAFAVLTSPIDFIRPYAAGDRLLGFRNPRELEVRADFLPEGGGQLMRVTRTLDLVRPPLTLMHGVWSEAESWNWFVQTDTRRFFDHTYQYKPDSGKPFLENYQHARKATELTLELFRGEGYAATQVDALAHSMGGNLFRMYIGGPAYGLNRGLPPSIVMAMAPQYKQHVNFGAGTVHKFIMFDSPQLGSPLANWMVDHPLAAFLFWLFKEKRADDGIAPDLRREAPGVPAEPIMAMPTIHVPVHAMMGGRGGQYLGKKWWIKAINLFIPGTIQSFLANLYAPEPDHDVIVGVCSQRAGLPLGPVAGIVTNDPEQSFHLNNKRAPDYNEEAIRLLNEPIASPRFASGLVQPVPGGLCSTFPPAAAPTAALAPTARKPAPTPSLVDGGLVITSPPPGTVVSAGATLPVTVEPANGFVPTRVLVGAGDDAEIEFAGGFDGTITIPLETFGDVSLQAIGLDALDEIATATPVVLHVEAPAALSALVPVSDKVVLTAGAPSTGLVIGGTFGDGVARDLTTPATGTTYESQDPAVATVDAEGVVTAVTGGRTLVRVANGGFEAIVDVRVTSTPSDADGDADVDILDFLDLRACWSGPGEDPSFQAPPNACRDVFDDDHDGDVDPEDYPAFLARYTEPLADCNVNAVPDLTDIVNGTSLDADANGVPDECGG